MYILDTDHLSLLQRNGQEAKQILKKLAATEDSAVFVTIITYEEQVRGRLGVLSRTKDLNAQVLAYQWLQQLVVDYQAIMLIPFDQTAALEHQRLRKAYPRLGTMDLKIAAIALVNNAILLTRNQADFGQIVELQAEDWTV